MSVVFEVMSECNTGFCASVIEVISDSLLVSRLR